MQGRATAPLWFGQINSAGTTRASAEPRPPRPAFPMPEPPQKERWMTDHATAAKCLRGRLGTRKPRLGIVLGSGLGDLAERVKDPAYLPYEEIPGFPMSTVAGHSGRFVIGTLEGQEVICMQGRLHSYEGYPYPALALPIRAMRDVGVDTLFLSNAAGSFHKDMPPGSLMAISDHVNWSGFNPLIGPNDDEIGPRFIDMSNAYDTELRARLRAVAGAEDIELHEGVYFWYTGPNFETPAEIRAFRSLGADAVGMSTVPETIAAVHCGMKVVAVSAITNLAAGLDAGETLSHEHTLAQSKTLSARFCRLVLAFVADLAPVPG
jgi:xanthosine phosphorylase